MLKLGDSVFHVVLSSNEDPLPATQPDAGVDLTATTPGPAASGKPDVDHQVWVLKRQVESLRAENMKMKQKLNPQRMRMARKEQQSKERELVMQVQVRYPLCALLYADPSPLGPGTPDLLRERS